MTVFEQSHYVGNTGIVTGDMVLDGGNDFGDGTEWGSWRLWPGPFPHCSVLLSLGTGLYLVHTSPKVLRILCLLPLGQNSLMALLRPPWPRLLGWQAREVISARSGGRSSRPRTLTQSRPSYLWSLSQGPGGVSVPRTCAGRGRG